MPTQFAAHAVAAQVPPQAKPRQELQTLPSTWQHLTIQHYLIFQHLKQLHNSLCSININPL